MIFKDLKCKQPLRLAVVIAILCCFQCSYDSREDYAMPSCNTDEITYQGEVSPILLAHCTGCHTSINPPAGLDFESHAGVAVAAMNGRLLGSIKHLPGYEAMPRFAPKLSDCDIAIIEKWINDGYVNN